MSQNPPRGDAPKDDGTLIGPLAGAATSGESTSGETVSGETIVGSLDRAELERHQDRAEPVLAGGASCSKCGQPLDQASRFCQACGTPVAASGAASAPEDEGTGQQVAAEHPAEHRAERLPPWFALFAIGWLIVMGVAFYFIYAFAFSIGAS